MDDRSWWARGLSLAERLATREGVAATRPLTERDRRRLDTWRLGQTPEQFAERLKRRGLDEHELQGLLSETPTALAERANRPSWAAHVERVLAAGGTPPVRHADHWYSGFSLILAPFVAVAEADLLAGIAQRQLRPILNEPRLRRSFRQQLTKCLVDIAKRTLVLELNVKLANRELNGLSPALRFHDFLTRLATQAGLRDLLGEYVVLARLLSEASQSRTAALLELLGRLDKDRAAIVSGLLRGIDPGGLTAAVAAGDPHQKGRAVAIMRFDDGRRVVYKPRSLACYRMFAALVAWLNARIVDLDLRSLNVIDCGEYGWVEFIEAQPCHHEPAITAYYQRTGALMALLYAVDATDIHVDNLIACADQPMIVDLETLLHPLMSPPGGPTADPAAEALETSVYRSLMLPRPVSGQSDLVDISGLGAEPAAAAVTSISIDASIMDQLRIVRRTTAFAGRRNQPRLGRVPAEPSGHVGALVAGFRKAHRALGTGAGELLSPLGVLRQFASAQTRIIVRTTQTYASALDDLTHPDVLRDGLDRDRAVEQLWSELPELADDRLVEAEDVDLWAGDVPKFFGRADSQDIWTSAGERLPGVLGESGTDRLHRKMATMGEDDLARQEWIIRAAFAGHARSPRHHDARYALVEWPDTEVDAAHLIATAQVIADRLLDRVYQAAHRANWIGLEPMTQRWWALRPLGAGLAYGYTGVALFLAQIGHTTACSRYSECAFGALTAVPRLLDRLAARPHQVRAIGCGGFEGLGGIAYALARMSALWASSELAQWAAEAVELMPAAVDADEQMGIIDGCAGALAAMLAVYRVTGSSRALDVATQAARRLVGRYDQPPDQTHTACPNRDHSGGSPGLGFARGHAGIAWSLAQFAAAGGGDDYAIVGNRLLATVPGVEHGGRHGQKPVHRGWCRGSAGIALAQAATAQTDRQSVSCSRSWHETALGDHGLCHGELGELEVMAALVSLGYHGVAEALVRRTALVARAIDESGPQCATPAGTPDLLNGLSGIGLGLLRLALPDQVPSVLLFATTN